MRPSENPSSPFKLALAASIAMHLAAFIYASQVTVAEIEDPRSEHFEVFLAMERSEPRAELAKSAAPVSQPPLQTQPQSDPVPQPDPEPSPEPKPLPKPEPKPIPEPEPEPKPVPKPTPAPDPVPAPPVEANPVPEARLDESPQRMAKASDDAPLDEKSGGPAPDSEPGIHEIDQLPRELSVLEPRYPVAEKRRGVEDLVQVRLLINEKGRVEEVEYLAGAPSFRRAIEAVVYRWRFEPATVDGQPVKVWGTKTVQFALHRN